MDVHHLVLVLLQIIFLLLPIKASTSCQAYCGDVSIRYPFGIGDRCSMDEWFNVTCDNEKPYLRRIDLELLDGFYYPSYMIAVKFPKVSLKNSTMAHAGGIDLTGSPFSFSNMQNSFISLGCYRYGSGTQNNSNTTACQSFCTCDPSQNGAGFCDVICTFPTYRMFNNAASISDFYSEGIRQNCSFASMVDQEWLQSNYLTNRSVLRGKEPIPARLEWGKYKGTCVELYSSHNKRCSTADIFCTIQLSSNHVCVCDNQMSDTDKVCTGDLICIAKSGYNCSAECPPGYSSYSLYSQDTSYTRCYPSEIWTKKSRVKLFTIIGAGLGMLLIIGIWWLYKFIKRRKAIKSKLKFFKRNGGLLLQQQLSSNEGNIEKTRLFTSKELVKATDNYNANRILGQGGQGTVYKGMLADGKIVAIKKSKVVDENKVEEFINEVVIISQINHRNVVQLLGCCLETEVPILVYEFIANGTLFQYIHDQNKEFPITWELLRRIAIEVAEALSYLHSAASIPIYHRDIKSTNILLDDKYRAKVSDFGTSRSVTIDQTHLTTQVKGTFGYLDPQYFQSSQFTGKSDVYSFGVVLAELLTGQKPILSTEFVEDRSLASYFLRSMKDNRLFDILDARVFKEGEKEDIMAVANLTRRCLNLNGKKRPTMREVAIELAWNKIAPSGASVMQQNWEEVDVDECGITHHYVTGSSLSTGSFFNSVTLDEDPLISS